MKITFRDNPVEKLGIGDIVESREDGHIAMVIKWESVYYVVNLETYRIENVAAFTRDLLDCYRVIGNLDKSELIIN